MVSGLEQNEQGEHVTIRNLPGNKSQSSISIPTSYQYYINNLSTGSQEGTIYSSPAVENFITATGSRGTLPQSSRRAIGPGYYHRTLSSSSLLTNKSSFSKSRSDYSSVGPNAFSERAATGVAGGGGTSNIKRGDRGIYHHPISGSSSNIIYIHDNNFEDPPQPFVSYEGCRDRKREFFNQERRLIRESSQPIIINVPITAPKATATTLSRATSPPPPQFSLQITSPKKILEKGKGQESEYQVPRSSRYHLKSNEDRYNGRHNDEESTISDTKGYEETDSGSDPKGNQQKRDALTKIEIDCHKPHVHFNKKDEEKVIIEGKEIPNTLKKYCRNAPLKKLKHPLEENIFSSLLITLLAVGVALIFGLPILILTGALHILAIVIRYSIYILYGCYSYVRFICSTRLRNIRPQPNQSPPTIFPRDRLAFANDIRWLGKKKPKQCQPILHTILVFEGTMDLPCLRHLVKNRVLHAETPEGELAYPRLLQNIISLPAGYQWDLDVTFDIHNHVFLGPSHIRNEQQMREYLSLLLMESLPVGKPLWEIRVFTNYGVQRDTLAIVRVHQCLADGMSLVRILSHALVDRPQMHVPVRPHFGGTSFGFNVIRSLIVGPLTFFMWIFTTFKDYNLFSIPLNRRKIKKLLQTSKLKNQDFETQIQSGDAGATGGDVLGFEASSNVGQKYVQSQTQTDGNESSSARKSPILGPNSKKKYQKKVTTGKKGMLKNKKKKRQSVATWNILWSAPVTLPEVGRIKQIMRSSLNDVLLACSAGSIRSYLQQQGIPFPNDVKAVIPVDLRNDLTSPKTNTKLGCKIASVLALIPTGIESAIPRLWATRQRLDELKASADPVVAYGVTNILMNMFPQKVGVRILESITDKASIQFSNLPGPCNTVLVGGVLLKGIFPIYPPSGNIRVAISFFTYADQIYLTILTHRSLKNAGPSLLQGITSQVDQLSRQLSHRRVPGESRRSNRSSSLNNPEITRPPTRQIHMQLQVVQEELQQLSHQLDTHQEHGGGMGHGATSATGPLTSINSDDFRSSEESLEVGVSSQSPAGQAHLRTRLKSLKNEFNDLIGELRRRSSIVEGVPMSFEDEELEDDFRKPRKRALSVVSISRRNSLFASRAVTTPESSVCYSSDEEMPSSPSHDVRVYNPKNIRHSSSPIRTTAV